MKKLGIKTKFRVTFLVLGLIISSVVFVSSAFSYVTQIYKTKSEINELKAQYNDKLTEEEDLKAQINKLQDPEYMAKYAREKYLYSGKNEIILKMDD